MSMDNSSLKPAVARMASSPSALSRTSRKLRLVLVALYLSTHGVAARKDDTGLGNFRAHVYKRLPTQDSHDTHASNTDALHDNMRTIEDFDLEARTQTHPQQLHNLRTASASKSLPDEKGFHRVLQLKVQLKTFFAYFLIGIAVLSLFGWAYIFYLRYQYNNKVEEDQIQATGTRGVQKCCKGGRSRGDAFPIKLDSPSRPSSRSRGVRGRADGEFPSPQDEHQSHQSHQGRDRRNTFNTSSVMSSHGGSSAPSQSNSTIQRGQKAKDDDDDSFARELQVAARSDQHTWAQFQDKQRAFMAKKKFVPSLKPSKKDVEHISSEHFVDNNMDFNSGAYRYGPKKRQQHNSPRGTPRTSYLPNKFAQPQRSPRNATENSNRNRNHLQTMNPFNTYDDSNTNDDFFRGRFQSTQNRPMHDQNQYTNHSQHNQMASLGSSDPSDIVLPSDDSSVNDIYSSATSDSYAGKSSSVEEGEGDGFHVVGYHRGVKDEMNTYLLNPMADDDDRSFGNSSGMEMSLGTNTAVSSAMSSDFTQGTAQGRGSASRGFYVINGENDLTDEYIPKEEYDAAVRAAANTLLSSPRNSTGKRFGALKHSGARGRNPDPYDLGELSIELYPSDEKQGEFSSSGDGFSTESTNFDPKTAFSSSVDTSSDPTLTHDIYKELKSVSNFIRKFEQKQSRQMQNLHDNDSSNFDLSTDTSTFVSSSSQPSLQLTNTSKTSGSSAKSAEKKRRFLRPNFSRKNKKGNVQEADFDDMEVKVKPKKKKQAKSNVQKNPHMHLLPPRHTTSTSYDQEEDDDDVVMMANHNRPQVSQKRQLPVAGNGQLPAIGISPSGESGASDTRFLHDEIESFFSQNDSTMPSPPQDTLHQKKTTNPPRSSAAKSVSEPPPQVDASFGNDSSFFTEFSGSNPAEKPGEFSRLGAAPFDPNQSPYHRNNSDGEDSPTPPKNVRLRGQSRKNSKFTPPLKSSVKDTQRVYPHTTSAMQQPAQNDVRNDSSQVPLAQSARSMLQTGAKSIASMLSPKHDDSYPSHDFEFQDNHPRSAKPPPHHSESGSKARKDGLPGLEAKLQNSAKSLLNMFESKPNENRSVDERSRDASNNSVDSKMSDRISSRLDQIRRNVKERTSQGSAPRSHRESRGTNGSYISNEGESFSRSKNVVQVATFVDEPQPQNMISPSSMKVRTERAPIRMLKTNDSNTTQNSGDFPTESRHANSTHNVSRTSERPTNIASEPLRKKTARKSSIGNAASTAGSTAGSTTSNAKSLISMFESKRANGSVGIFPPGENWQSGISRKLFK